MHINIIATVCEDNHGIGSKGRAPWGRVPWGVNDADYFTRITKKAFDPHKQTAVIMGRKTWESLPDEYKPLPSRMNIILSKYYRGWNKILEGDCEYKNTKVFPTFNKAVESLKNQNNIETVWAIGGARVFKAALRHNLCRNLYVTWIKNKFEGCDTFMPKIPESFIEYNGRCYMAPNKMGVRVENYIAYRIAVYTRQMRVTRSSKNTEDIVEYNFML